MTMQIDPLVLHPTGCSSRCGGQRSVARLGQVLSSYPMVIPALFCRSLSLQHNIEYDFAENFIIASPLSLQVACNSFFLRWATFSE